MGLENGQSKTSQNGNQRNKSCWEEADVQVKEWEEVCKEWRGWQYKPDWKPLHNEKEGRKAQPEILHFKMLLTFRDGVGYAEFLLVHPWELILTEK